MGSQREGVLVVVVIGLGLADAAGWQPRVVVLSRARHWGCVAFKVTDVKRQDKSQGGGQVRGQQGWGMGARRLCPQQLHNGDPDLCTPMHPTSKTHPEAIPWQTPVATL